MGTWESTAPGPEKLTSSIPRGGLPAQSPRALRFPRKNRPQQPTPQPAQRNNLESISEPHPAFTRPAARKPSRSAAEGNWPHRRWQLAPPQVAVGPTAGGSRPHRRWQVVAAEDYPPPAHNHPRLQDQKRSAPQSLIPVSCFLIPVFCPPSPYPPGVSFSQNLADHFRERPNQRPNSPW